jgi:hypothetical protein
MRHLNTALRERQAERELADSESFVKNYMSYEIIRRWGRFGMAFLNPYYFAHRTRVSDRPAGIEAVHPQDARLQQRPRHAQGSSLHFGVYNFVRAVHPRSPLALRGLSRLSVPHRHTKASCEIPVPLLDCNRRVSFAA